MSNNSGSHARYRNARAGAIETSSFTSIDSNFEPLCVSSPGRQKTKSPIKRSNIITSPVKSSRISPRKRYIREDRCRNGSNTSASKDSIERTNSRDDVHKREIISKQSQSPKRASKAKDKIRSSDRSRNHCHTLPNSEQKSRHKRVSGETDFEREQNQRKIDANRNKDKNRETKRDRGAYKDNCISVGRREPCGRINLNHADDPEENIDSERVERKHSCRKNVFDLREKLKLKRLQDQTTGEVLDENSQKTVSMPQLSLANLPNGNVQDRVNVIQLATSHSDISAFTNNKSHSVISEPKDNADKNKREAKKIEKQDDLLAAKEFLQKLKCSINSSESSLMTSSSRKEQEKPFSRALISYSDMSYENSELECNASIYKIKANEKNVLSASGVSSHKSACETFIQSGMNTDFKEVSCGKFSRSRDVNELLFLNERTLVNESCNLEVDSHTMNKSLDTSENKFADLKQMNCKSSNHIHESETKDYDTSPRVDINIERHCSVDIEDKLYNRMLLSPDTNNTNSRSTDICDSKTPTEFDLECSINQMNASAGRDGAMFKSNIETSAGITQELTKCENNNVIALRTPQLEVIASSIKHSKEKSVENPVKCFEQTRDDTDDSSVSNKMTATMLKGTLDTVRRRSARLLLRSDSSVSMCESKSETNNVFESEMEMNKSEDSKAVDHDSSTMETEQNMMPSKNISSSTAHRSSSEKKKKRIRRCVISETISCVTSVDMSDSVSEVFQTDSPDENLDFRTEGTKTSEETGISESSSLLKNSICHYENCKIKMRHLHPKLHKNIEKLEAPMNKNESMQCNQSLNRKLVERISGVSNEKNRDINISCDSKDFAESEILVHKNIQAAKTTMLNVSANESELDVISSSDDSGHSHACSSSSTGSDSDISEVSDETDGMQKEQTVSYRDQCETMVTDDIFEDKHVKETQISMSAIETMGQIENNTKQSVSTELHANKKRDLFEDLGTANLIAEYSEEKEHVSSREIPTEHFAETVPSTNSFVENKFFDADSKITKDTEVCNRSENDHNVIVNIDQSCSSIMPVIEGCELEKVHPTRGGEEMLNILELHNLLSLENGERKNINDRVDDRSCSEKVVSVETTLKIVTDNTENNSTCEFKEEDLITIGNGQTTKTVIVACNKEVGLNAVIDGSGLENVKLYENNRKPHSIDSLKCDSSTNGENDVSTKEVFEEDAVTFENKIIKKNVSNAQMLTYVENGTLPNKNNIDNSANESEGSFGSNIMSERTDSSISTDDSDISDSDDSSENSYSDGSSYSSSDESGSGSSWESYSSDSYPDEARNDQMTRKKTTFDKEKVSEIGGTTESLTKVDIGINHIDKTEKNGETEGAHTLITVDVEGKDTVCVAMTVEGNNSNEERTYKKDSNDNKDSIEVGEVEDSARRTSLNGNSIIVQESASEAMCFMDEPLNNPLMQNFPDKTSVQKSPNKVKYIDSPVKIAADKVKDKTSLVEVSNVRELVEDRNANVKSICSTTSMSPNKQLLDELKSPENIPNQVPNRSNLLQCLLNCVQKEFAHKETCIDQSAQNRNKLSDGGSKGDFIDVKNLEKDPVNDSIAVAGIMNDTQTSIVASNDTLKSSQHTVIVNKSVEHTESVKHSQEMCGNLNEYVLIETEAKPDDREVEDKSVDKEYEGNIFGCVLSSTDESEESGTESGSHPTDCSTCSSYTDSSTESDSNSYVLSENESRSKNTFCGKDKNSTDIVAYAKEKQINKNSSSRDFITDSNCNDVKKTIETEKDRRLENTVAAEANIVMELSPTKSNPYWIEDEMPAFLITEDSSKFMKANEKRKPLKLTAIKSPKSEESNSTPAVKFVFSPQKHLNVSSNKSHSISVVRMPSLGDITSSEFTETTSDKQLKKQFTIGNMDRTDERSNKVTSILTEGLKSQSTCVNEYVGLKRNTCSSRNLLEESTASRDKHNMSTEKKWTNKRCIDSNKISNKITENNQKGNGQNIVNSNGQKTLLKNEDSFIEKAFECTISDSLDRHGKKKTPLKNKGNSLKTRSIVNLTDTQSLRRSPRKKPHNVSVVTRGKEAKIMKPAEKEMTVTKRTSVRKSSSSYEKQSSIKNKMLDIDLKISKSESKVSSSRSTTKQTDKTATSKHIKHETKETKSKITSSKYCENDEYKQNFNNKKSVESPNLSLEASRVTCKTKSNGQSYAKGKISLFEKGHFRDTTKEFSDKIMKLKVEQNMLKTRLAKRQMEEKESLTMRITLPKELDLKCQKKPKENMLKGKASLPRSGTNKQLKVALAANGHQRIRRQHVASKTGSLNKKETKTFEEKLSEGYIAKCVQKVSKHGSEVLPVSLSVETLKTYTIPKLLVGGKEIREKSKTDKNIPTNRGESSVSMNSPSHEVSTNEKKRHIENICSNKNGKRGCKNIVHNLYRDATKGAKHCSDSDSDLGASSDIESESEDSDSLVKAIFGSSDSSGNNNNSITLADLRKTRSSEDTDDIVMDNLLDDKVNVPCRRDLTDLIEVDNKAIEKQRQEASKLGKVKDKQNQKGRKYVTGVQDNSSEIKMTRVQDNRNNKICDKGRKCVSNIVNVNSTNYSLKQNEKDNNLQTSDNYSLIQEASKLCKLKEKQKLKDRKYVARVQDNCSEYKIGDKDRSYTSKIVNVNLKSDYIKQNDKEENLETSDNLCQKNHLSKHDKSGENENRKSVTGSRKSSRIKVKESPTKRPSCTNKNGNKSSDSKDGANTNKILRRSRSPKKSELPQIEEVRYFEISDKNPVLRKIVSPKKPNSNHYNGDSYNNDVIEHNVVNTCDAIDVEKPIQLDTALMPIILLEENTMDGIDYDDDMSLDIGSVNQMRTEDSTCNKELADRKLGKRVENNAICTSNKEKATNECIEEGQLSDSDTGTETDKLMDRKAGVIFQMCNEMTPKKTKVATGLINDRHKFSPIQFPHSPDTKSSYGEDSSGQCDDRKLHELNDRKHRKRYRNDSDTCSDISTPQRQRHRGNREFSSDRKQRTCRSTERSNSPRTGRRKTDGRSQIHAHRRTPSPRRRTRRSVSHSKHRFRHRSRSKSSSHRERRRRLRSITPVKYRESDRDRQVNRGHNKYRNYSESGSLRQHRRKRYCSDERSPSVDSNCQERRHRYTRNSSTKITREKKRSPRYAADDDSFSSDCSSSKETKGISRSQSREDESSDTENPRFSKRHSEKSRTIEADLKYKENSLRNSDTKQTRGNSSYTFGDNSRSRVRSHERKRKRYRSESVSDVELNVAEIVGSKNSKTKHKHKMSERDSPDRKRSRVDKSDAKSKCRVIN